MNVDTRYSHPEVAELWSPRWTYAAWLVIETRTLVAQRAHGVVPDEPTRELEKRLVGMSFQDADVDDIRAFEETSKHDVVAFLDWLRLEADDEGEDILGRWVHFGLTSSDLVDTAQGMRFAQMRPVLIDALDALASGLGRWTGDPTPIVGRTHGQVAEPMEMRARAWGWLTLLATGAADVSRFTSRMAVCKLSGPVGTYAHNPPQIENAVARDLRLRPHGPGATQIASRAPLAAWAGAANSVVQACAKIAHDVRLMIAFGEASIENAPGQVGSSSMAHKVNPIRAEKIAGMARLAGGYALMLSDLGTWLERDISMSSVERVAVPDLWHVLLHAVEETTVLLRGLMVREQTPPADAYVSWQTLRHVEQGQPIDTAREMARTRQAARPGQAPSEFMRNYHPSDGGRGESA